jgi:flagellar hook protein FlgE
MKRISKSLLFLLLAVTVPFMMASGQDKKKEQKVKVVIADKGGTKTVIDTVFTDGSMPDSITLENGKVVYFAKNESDVSHFRIADGKGNVYVTCIVDDDGKETVEKEVIVTSGDDGEWTITRPAGNKQHVYVQADSDGKGEKTEKHVVITSTESKDAVWEENDGKTFHVTVKSDGDTDTEMTKYVIAKDGVVVTVESNDEAKAKEIIKLIEDKLDVKVKK